MSKLAEHPDVKSYYERHENADAAPAGAIEAGMLKRLCIEAGADDAGFVEIDRPEIADQKSEILSVFPKAKTLIAFVRKMNREAIRSPARSIANTEFHITGDEVNDTARKIAASLQELGIRALNTVMGFPMEMDRFPGKSWVLSHKPIAVAAGLGKMGIHRNVIHPKFGNFILLGTVVIDREVTAYDRPIDYNPCLSCKLCVAACPVGAISPEGSFNFSSCYAHNYREFMGGFTDWATKIADSKNGEDYRNRVTESESASMWQSLSFGANYKAAYCMAVCPAGEDVIGRYLDDKKEFLKDVVKPLQEKTETIYVIGESDAEEYVKKRFPNKKTKRVGKVFYLTSVKGFLRGLALTFQPKRSEGLNAVYRFTFTGKESAEATVAIRNQTLQVREGHEGDPDLSIIADSGEWLDFLNTKRGLLWALLRRKIRIKGSPKLLISFGKCFPS